MDINIPVILVIDDDDAIRELVSEILMRAGYSVSGVESSKCGYCLLDVSLLLGRPFDLVVSDVVMPGENGPAMIERFCAERGVDFRVLFMSGYTRQALVGEGILGTGQEFLPKPFNPADLLSKVGKMLGVAECG